MRKTLVLIRIFSKLGHGFYWSENVLRLINNPGILRAYFRYSHVFTGEEDMNMAAALALISYFRHDPKNGVSFPLTVLPPTPKKGLLQAR